jgi:hypothetical protein
MKTPFNDPTQPVPFGQGMQISLNNYYDLLKANAGNLGANEFVQLKLAADIVDISAKKNKDGGYEWNSYYNLLTRSDVGIDPGPISGSVLANVAHFSALYGNFLNQLSRYVVIRQLSKEDQQALADLNKELGGIKDKLKALIKQDRQDWNDYCAANQFNPADTVRYVQWAQTLGNGNDIRDLLSTQAEKEFSVIQIINRKYANAGDQEIMDAMVKYKSNAMQMCYPFLFDYQYSSLITLDYLLSLLPTATGQFDFRYVYGFNLDLPTIRGTAAGAIDASYDRTTDDSSSITTDWSASGSVGYLFLSVNASASEHTKITEDFKTATGIHLISKAAFRLNINYAPWFDANLFNSHYITENPKDFLEFFGPKGSLLYYPTALILVRGFSAEFTNSQAWTYDYEHNFQASVGGGFNIFGINFGGSSSYGSHVTGHKVDQSNTSLKISDDENTIRFVGYAVKKNTDLSAVLTKSFKSQFKFASV